MKNKKSNKRSCKVKNRKPAARVVVINFPKPLLEELDALCEFNYLGRTEFITFAATLMLDYLDRKVGPSSLMPEWKDEVFEAAEGDDTGDTW